MKSPADLADYPWSKSSLSSLLTGCSWQWALKKVYGLKDHGSPATALGTALHAAIEEHERRRIVALRTGDKALALAPMSFDALVASARVELAEAVKELPADTWAKHDTSYADLGELLAHSLNNWWHADAGDGRSLRDRIMAMRPISCEPGFNVGLESLGLGDLGLGLGRVHGFIDWFGYDHDTAEYVVIDYKTAGNFRYWAHGGDGHEVEAATYVVAGEVARNLPARYGNVRMEWHVVRKAAPSTHHAWQGARAVVRHVSERDRDLLAGQVTMASRTVELSAYRTNPDWNLCSKKWCSFYNDCQITGRLAPGGPGLDAL